MSHGQIDVESRLSRALSQLHSDCAEVNDYITARRSGFVPIARTLTISNAGAISSLSLKQGVIERTISSDKVGFHHCALSHCYTSRALLLPEELSDEPIPGNERPPGPGPVTVEVEAGLFRASGPDIRHFEFVEAPLLSRRGYRLWIAGAAAESLDLVSCDPTFVVRIRMAGSIANMLHGFVDQLTPFVHGDESLIEISGVDGLFGTRALVSGKFNFRVEPWWGMALLAAWCDPALLSGGGDLKQPSLEGIDGFLSGLPPKGSEQFLEFLERQAVTHSGTDLEILSNVFGQEIAARPQQYSPFTALGFRNTAIILHNHLPVQLVIGSLRGLRVDGVLSLSPNLIVADPKQIPFHLHGERRNGTLCEHWDPEASRVVTFCLAKSAPDTPDAGHESLLRAFNFINLASMDAGWLHSRLSKREARLPVNSKTQDAILELEPWYHVHDLVSGTAHQYYARRDRSTNTLVLDDSAAQSLSLRLNVFQRMYSYTQSGMPILQSHLMNAVRWLSRSRGSTTMSERFLCAWIALEFLVLRGTTDDDAIKGAVSSRIGALMGRGNRTRRRYWQKLMEDAYDLRCLLVHEAKEDEVAAARLIPFVTQAAVEVITYCSLSLSDITQDISPTEILDRLCAPPSAPTL